MTVTEKLRCIAKQSGEGLWFPIDEIIQDCYDKAKTGKYSKAFKPSVFGLDDYPTNEQARKRQVDLIDLAMEALRERGLSKVYALNTKEGFVDSVIVDWH
ncbi:hypothetical protein ESCO9_00074 [Escherichia phage vB_EcoM_ESCO9]|nr:hypothetical protein ESCO9_00074 [Escherichia phage vB_EcoM_ESCO9]